LVGWRYALDVLKRRKRLNQGEKERTLIREMKKFTREMAKSPKKARQFLIDAGIVTKTGRLTKQYR
jgi:hypothetical protein